MLGRKATRVGGSGLSIRDQIDVWAGAHGGGGFRFEGAVRAVDQMQADRLRSGHSVIGHPDRSVPVVPYILKCAAGAEVLHHVVRLRGGRQFLGAHNGGWVQA